MRIGLVLATWCCVPAFSLNEQPIRGLHVHESMYWLEV